MTAHVCPKKNGRQFFFFLPSVNKSFCVPHSPFFSTLLCAGYEREAVGCINPKNHRGLIVRAGEVFLVVQTHA